MVQNLTQNLTIDVNQQLTDSVFGSIQILDQNTGKITEYPMHSLLKNFGSLFYSYGIHGDTPQRTGLYSTKSNGTADQYGKLTSYAVSTGMQVTSHISIGTGSTTKTNHMTSLGGLIPTANLSWLTMQPYYTLSDGTKSVTFQKKFTNNTANTMQITELGFTQYKSTDVYTLFGYDNLQTPYELGAGSTSIFKFKLHFSYNFGNYFPYNLSSFGGGTTLAFTEISGSGCSIGSYPKPMYLGYANSNTAGIVVGTSSTALVANEYKLGGILPPSTMSCTANQIQNGFQEPEQNLYLYRTFTNITDSDQVINQIGLYVEPVSSYRTAMIWRKVLTTPITVSAGNQLLMQLRIAPNY